jgi:DNA-binding response OmpR family regulator
VALSPREWAILNALLDARQEYVDSIQLEARLWGESGHHSTLASTISRLRNKLRAHHLVGLEISTARGRGYAARYQPDRTVPLRAHANDDHKI